MNYNHALQLAKEVVDHLTPSCERIEIAGGIRRGKENPHDIEIVARPHFQGEAPLDLMGEPIYNDYLPRNELHDVVVHGIKVGFFQPGDLVTQHRNGKTFQIKAPFSDKYYRIKYKGEKVDLFAVTPPAQWGVVFTLRTGDAGFSHWLVSQGWPKGIYFREGQLVRHVDLEGRYIPEGQKHAHGECRTETIPTPEEKDVFEAVGVPWLDPEKRVFENSIVV